jgi:hypothetical protein
VHFSPVWGFLLAFFFALQKPIQQKPIFGFPPF